MELQILKESIRERLLTDPRLRNKIAIEAEVHEQTVFRLAKNSSAKLLNKVYSRAIKKVLNVREIAEFKAYEETFKIASI